MKPVIGVLPSIGKERDRIFILKAYMTAVRDSGGLPVLLYPETEELQIKEVLDLCDGIIFSGGEDISPSLYGENNLNGVSIVCEERDFSENVFLKEALARRMPIFGICRGIQSLNVLFGGTLYQDIDLQIPSSVCHMQDRSDPKPSHLVKIHKNSGLYQLMNADMIEVNSYHHQAIKDLAKGLICSAESEDGLCEAIEKPDYPFLWAVQWHPERIYRTDKPSRLLILRFIEAASEYRTSK